uniref:Cbp1 family collagen-binding glycoprotein adhesin n=1 Tax=uncultured Draconibacterium sp. TaxID=1573823 RepID=UPI0032165191
MEKKEKSSKIITGAVLAALFLTVVIGGLIVNKNKKAINQLSSENTKLEMVVQERDSMVNEFISAFDTIESSLTFINEKRGQLVLNNNEITVTQKDAIIRDIELMNTMLEESSLKIEKLEKDLKNSGFQLRSFKKKVASLSEQIEKQNQQIAEFKLQFEAQNKQLAAVSYEKDSLQNEVLAIQDTVQKRDELVAQMEELIGQQTNELNKGFFAYGTTKELTENGVIAKEGGFLGIGQSKTVPKDFNEDYFTKIDITQDRSIELNAKKVKLISEHPADSYKLIEEDGLITRLEIETPQDFWKISQYAVIEVKL